MGCNNFLKTILNIEFIIQLRDDIWKLFNFIVWYFRDSYT